MYDQFGVTTAFVCPVYVIVIVVGSLGNGFLVHSYVMDKSIQHRVFNFLVTNLATVDLLMCALFTPLLLIYRAMASAAVIAISPLCELCIFLSMLSISMMYCMFPLLAFHRNDVMLRPKKPYLSLVRCRKLTACFWLLCFLASVGIVLMAWREFLSDDLIPKLYRCILVNTQVDDYSLAFLLYSSSLYGLSIVGTVISYVITFTANVDSTAEDRCVTKLCVLVSVVYTVCWMPFLLVQLLGIFGSYTEVHFNLHACASAIGVLASVINPGIYTTMDPYYRAKFRSLLFSKTGTDVKKSG